MNMSSELNFGDVVILVLVMVWIYVGRNVISVAINPDVVSALRRLGEELLLP